MFLLLLLLLFLLHYDLIEACLMYVLIGAKKLLLLPLLDLCVYAYMYVCRRLGLQSMIAFVGRCDDVMEIHILDNCWNTFEMSINLMENI